MNNNSCDSIVKSVVELSVTPKKTINIDESRLPWNIGVTTDSKKNKKTTDCIMFQICIAQVYKPAIKCFLPYHPANIEGMMMTTILAVCLFKLLAEFATIPHRLPCHSIKNKHP